MIDEFTDVLNSLLHIRNADVYVTGRDHIIEIALDDRLNKNLRDPDVILQHIHERIVDDKLYYIILDEVQMIDEFTDVLNSLLHIRKQHVETYTPIA
jgi:predicted AAA+ superfamily ATPase